MNKLVKVVSVAVIASISILSLAGCKDPGKAGPGKKVAVWSDGEKTLGVQNARRTMRAIEPKSSCSWTLMYDLPDGKVVVVSKGGAKAAKKGVKMWGPGTLSYKDPKTGKMVTKKAHATSFYSENCGPWREK